MLDCEIPEVGNRKQTESGLDPHRKFIHNQSDLENLAVLTIKR